MFTIENGRRVSYQSNKEPNECREQEEDQGVVNLLGVHIVVSLAIQAMIICFVRIRERVRVVRR